MTLPGDQVLASESMDESLFHLILRSQEIEYAIFDAQDNLVQCTPGLQQSIMGLSDSRKIADIFLELVGYEQILDAIRKHEQDPLILENIQGHCIKDGQKYIDLQVYPFKGGIIVIVRDNTVRANLQRMVWQRRNELDLMTDELIHDLKKANDDMIQAYESTLEGWARALELRDFETQGHSQRVTGLAVEIAQHMGLTAERLIDVRRGALLHDIGKMSIPDDILLKPAPLTNAEWTIMRRHPVYAFELLSPIPFLRPALPIPYYHHERWNGSGYPLGLRGEQIPLEARIFSVVDVWDALSSDRPYRDAWPKEKVLKYILAEKDILFDPLVVDVFIKLIEEYNVFSQRGAEYV